MIRALWFMLKVGIFVAIAVWVADHPGYVNMEFAEYGLRLRVNTGLFLLSLLIVILIALFFYRILQTITRIPYNVQSFMKNRRRDQGYKALSVGLTAVAAGDVKQAARCADKAVRLLPDDKGLPLLLLAQSQRMTGDDDGARKTFTALMRNKDTSFLGVRGLLQAAMDDNDHDQALALTEQALEMHPGQPWILKLAYDLQIQNRDWVRAKYTLARAEKKGAIEKPQAVKDRIAILLVEADEAIARDAKKEAISKLKKAHKTDPGFVPTIERLARVYMQNNQRRKAQNILEKAWKASDHPELARIWAEMTPEHKITDPTAAMKWMVKLEKHQPESAETFLALAKTAVDHRLWGDAREYLARSRDIREGARLFKLYAEVEKSQHGDDQKAQEWQEKAVEAEPGKRWVCSQTGRLYDTWQPIADPHGSFNTIEWTYPHGTPGAEALLPPANDDMNEGQELLDVPA